MSLKAAKSENTLTPNAVTDENRELTPNELATIHGGGTAASSKGQVFLVVKMSDCMISSYSIDSTTSQPR